MTNPSWRKWFSHCARNAVFALRAAFSFSKKLVDMSPIVGPLVRFCRKQIMRVIGADVLSSRIVARVISMVSFVAALSSELYRKHRRATAFVSGTLAVALVATSVFFVVRARAEKEVHAFITPSYVSGEGVENVNAAATQDLSMDAQFADFALAYSARVAFGSYTTGINDATSTNAHDLESATSTPPDSATTSTPTTAPISVPAASSNDVSTSSSVVSSGTTTNNMVAPVVPDLSSSTSLPVSAKESASGDAPSIIDTVQSVIHAVLPFVPAPASSAPADAPAAPATVTPADASSTPSPLSLLLRSTAEKALGVKTALALDAPVADATAPSPAATTPATSDADAVPAVVATPVSGSASTSAADATQTQAQSGENSAPVDLAQPDKPDDPDPYKTASCTLFGSPCHMIVLEGFGVGQELSKYPVRNAQLMVSLAGRGAPQEKNDRIVFRAYKNNRWVYLGEQQVTGEFDNASRGGFLTFPLQLSSWSDLANMKIAVEYVREHVDGERGNGDAVMLLDAAWVDVGFGADVAPDDLALLSPNVKSALMARDAAQKIRERDHLDLGNGEHIDFTSLMSQTPGARLRVALTSDKHATLGSGEEYVAVTNMGKSAESVRLSFHFPEDGGAIDSIARFEHNVPHKIVETESAPIAYVCASGWKLVTSTDELTTEKRYSCDAGMSAASSTDASTTAPSASSSSSLSVIDVETHVCSQVSDDGTNCFAQVSAVGEHEETVYRNDFVPDAVFHGSFRDSESIFVRAMDALLSEMPADILPTTVREVSYSNPFEIEPGATKYFRVGYSTPINARGDFYVEAVAASGAYGLGHSSYDGSWTWRLPIDVGLPYASAGGETAVPVSLDRMPLTFWNHVKTDGSDLRFTDEDATQELPYWIANWNFAQRSGLVWVRLPSGAGVMPRIYAYAGDPSAASESKPWAPFSTGALTARATLVGKSGEESDVVVTSLTPSVQVSIDGHDQRTLLLGETVLFEHVTNGQMLRATGPVAAVARSVFSHAVMAPLGLAGLSARIPSGTEELALSSPLGEDYSAHVGERDIDIASSTTFRMPIDGEEFATASVPTLFVASAHDKTSIILPSEDDSRVQLGASALLPEKTAAVRVTCDDVTASFGAFDPRGTLVASSTCGVSLNGPFDAGSVVRMLEDASSSARGAYFFAQEVFDTPLTLLDSFARDAGGEGAQTALGEPETVIPSEHRVFDRENGKDRTHVNRFLSVRREFSADETPTFTFQYRPQSNSFFRKLRSFFGFAAFSVEDIVLEQNGKQIPVKPEVSYGQNFNWTIKLPEDAKRHMTPGMLTLRMKIHEGSSVYDDAYDFYWGLLAMNFNKATYEQGETADIAIGALSSNGNTVCDAKLKLIVTSPASSTEEIQVTPSGKCDGNNVIDVPDYSAHYTMPDPGMYHMRLVRLDETGNIVADESENVSVVPHMDYVIEREGPTRINPQYPYKMTLRVFARSDYHGTLVEKVPGDFEFIDRGGSTLSWADDAHDAKLATWNVDMRAGEVYQYTYSFQAPVVSPYIFMMGPATIDSYTEPRTWQIASDAAGKMIIYWDQGTTPNGWDCMSCTATSTMYGVYLMGSSTAGVTGGSATHTHTLTATVGSPVGATAGVGGTGTTLAYSAHTHTFSPTIGSGSNLPLSFSYRILRSQSAGEVNVPAGAILYFESTTTAGWTQITGYEGQYIYGYSGIFQTQGSATHNHTLSGTTAAAAQPTRYTTYIGTTPTAANATHTHTLSATTTNSVSNDPPYTTYFIMKSNVTQTVPNGAIAMWDNDPASGWIRISDTGGIMSNRFVRVDFSANTTGGHATHDHLDMLGLPLSAASAGTNTGTGGSLFSILTTHTHKVDLTNFSVASNLPPYYTVVYAKRSVGLPLLTQLDYRFYGNVNDVQPVDPWPVGPVDIAQNTAPDDITYRIHPGSIFRLRLGVNVQNATTTAGTVPVKLQYSTDGNSCASDLNWNDVGAPGSGQPLMGYTNSLVPNGQKLQAALLATTTSGALEAYNDSSTSTAFATTASVGANTEWDFSLIGGTALASSTRYCLRAVEASGKVFGGYTNFPNFLTNASPLAPTPNLPFNHAMFATTTPQLTFAASDPEGDGEHYEVQIDTNYSFSAPVVDATTQNSAASFSNINNPTNKAPYTSGDMVQYQVPAAKLTNGNTYWWHVRAKDPGGSQNYGQWSTPRAITINTALTTSAWFQTTNEQFQQDSLTNITVSGGSATLSAGTTTGSIVSPEIVFSEGPYGTVWGSLVSNKSAGTAITFQVQYKSSSGDWVLVPDALLPGNSTGTSSANINLQNIDPLYYPSLRFIANFNSSGAQALNDLTVNWANKTLAPIISQPFSHVQVATTTPTFYFSAVDPLGYNIRYQFQWGTDPTFAAPSTCNSNVTAPVCGTWSDTVTGSSTGPFASGHTVTFVPNVALTNNTTYYYRIKGMGETAGVWSFWSEVRAISINTSMMAFPTWFQTDKGQFDMDTLAGAYSVAPGSIAVATTSDKVLVAYGSGSDPQPKYRIYNQGVISGEGSALSISSTVLWAGLDSSQTNDQFILGTMGADQNIRYQVFENGVWSRMLTMPDTGPSKTRKSFDISYETKSGRALAVACSSQNLSYAIFDGSSWGSVQSLSTGFTNACELVKMASNPTKNEIALAVRDTGTTYRSFIWNGSSWSAAHALTGSAGENIHDALAVGYSANGTYAVVVTGNGTATSFNWQTWNGSTWSANATVTTSNQFDWGTLRQDPTSGNILLCSTERYSTTDDGAYANYYRFTGPSTWTKYSGSIYPYTHHGIQNDCAYTTKGTYSGSWMTVFDESWLTGDGSSSNFLTKWDTINSSGTFSSGQATGRHSGNTIFSKETWTSLMARASASGNILSMVLGRNSSSVYSYTIGLWNGTAWSTLLDPVATPSVTTKPFGSPFDMTVQDGLLNGRIFSSPINFADGQAPAWRNLSFTQTVPGGASALVSVEYYSTSTGWARIPDADLPGNSLGTSTSPINLANLNSNTYNTIRLRDDLACNGFSACPSLSDWTVTWAQGLSVSGKARDYDRTTLVTSGTVKVAVNGTEQVGKTASIDASGNWSIPGVSYRSGDVVTVWISGAATSSRAAAVAKFGGAGSLSGMELSRRWLVIGDTTQAGVTISNANIGLKDNASGANPDLFFDVDGSNSLYTCGPSAGACADASVAVVAGTTWQPNSAGGTTNSLYSLALNGTLTADTNTYKVAGNWKNTSIFSPGASTVVFNGTSSVRTIDSTGASQYKFNDVVLGEAGDAATWQLNTQLYTNGNLTLNYGTFNPGAQSVNIEKNLAIGANGTWTTGTATTTFLGVPAANWSDATAAGQDIGNVAISGSPKNLTLGSNVKATNVLITPGDSLSLSVNTLTIDGNFTNTGSFNANAGTLAINGPAATQAIALGGASLNNLYVLNGNVTMTDALATTTGDVTIASGTVALSATSMSIGGGLSQTGGILTVPNQLTFNSSATGKVVSTLVSLKNVTFSGSGSYSFGTNATSTGNVTINAGSVKLPSGMLAVSGNFAKTAGSLDGNNGVLYMNGGVQTIALGGASLANVTLAGGSTTTISDANATLTGSLIVSSSSTFNFPNSGSLTIGGSFINNGTANANASLLTMNRASGPATLQSNGMVLSQLTIDSVGMTTASDNIRVSATTTLTANAHFTVASGKTLRVDGFFTNAATDANTTWTGATLDLTSGATMALNTKTSGADSYDTMVLDNGTAVRMWNSSANAITTNASSSVYGMNWAGVSGALRIFGAYTQNSGTAYWDANTDFDGTALGTPRVANVQFASSSIVSFASSSVLEMLGASTATTTLTPISNLYSLNIATSTWKAQYASVRGLTTNGVNLSGSSTIQQLDNTAFIVDANNGYAITMAKQVVDASAGKQFSYDSFATGTAATAWSVRVPTASTNWVRFKFHSGALSGEAHDADSGDPGEVRWDDSSYVINVTGVVRKQDDSGPDTTMCDDVSQYVAIKVVSATTFYARTTCSSADGTFSFSTTTGNAASYKNEPMISVYLTNGAPSKGVTVSRGATGDITNFNVIESRITLRNEDVNPITNAFLQSWTASNDADMLYMVSSGNLTVPKDDELYVLPGKVFTPGGNVTTNSGGIATYGGRLHIGAAATYNATGNELVSVGGDYLVDAGGAFNAASSTLVLTPSDTRYFVTPTGSSFSAITFAGTGTTTIQSTFTVNGNIAVNSGGVVTQGVRTITALKNFSGNGTVQSPAGTFNMPNGGNIGGNTLWSLYKLNLGDGVTLATTTKQGTGTTTVSGVLTVNVNHTFDLQGKPLVLSGAGTPLVVNGNAKLLTTGGTVIYAGTGAANVANVPYNNLTFNCSATATLPTMTLNIAGTFSVASGTVTALPNSTALTIGADVNIGANGTFIGATAATTTVSGNWTNAGTYTSSLGMVQFVGSGNKSINPGASAFGLVDFNDPSGSWTIAQNATATQMSLSSVSAWTLASGKTLAITGNFTNAVGAPKTTWTGSTLALSTGSTDYVNSKSGGADTYGTIALSGGTQVVLWNSSSTALTSAPGSGLVSFNHGGVNGLATIFGDYVRNSGNEYWDYANDWDGTALGVPRQANVKFASGATASYGGTSVLDITGSASATTTVRGLGAGYGLSIGGASTSLYYFDIAGTNATGTLFTNAVNIARIDNGIFASSTFPGTLVTVMGTAMNANPSLTLHYDGFVGTVAANDYNITATGTISTFWRITNHYGALAGEAHNNDPAGDPGYLVWDDSAAQISVSGKVLKTDGVTPSSICSASIQNVYMLISSTSTPQKTACAPATGAFSFININHNPNDTVTVYFASTTATGTSVALDPQTSIFDMNVYDNTLTVRNENTNPIKNSDLGKWTKSNDAKIPFIVSGNNVTLDKGMKLMVWTSRRFAPGGNVALTNTNSTAVEGDVELRNNAMWQTTSGEQDTIGGNLTLGTNAVVNGPGEFQFTATAAKTITGTNASLPSLRFSGTGGWTMSGIATTTGNVNILAGSGTVALPNTAFAVGGSFNNLATFNASGATTTFFATTSGQTIKTNGSAFANMTFAGVGGGWTFQDAATSSGNFTVASGTVTLSASTTAIGGDFQNQGGAFVSNGGTVRMYGTGARTLNPGGSSFNNLTIGGAGTFTMPLQSATTTGDLLMATGTLALPVAGFDVGGTFKSTGGLFVAGATSTVRLYANTTGKLVNPGASSFNNLIVDAGASGGYTFEANATTTGILNLKTANVLVISPNTRLGVMGAFTNSIGGTWATTTLSLFGASTGAIDQRGGAAANYNIVNLGPGVNASSWNASYATVTTAAGASLYSQWDGGVNGTLKIYGTYVRSSGADYWSAGSDFDGTTAAQHTVNVLFAPGASATYASSSQLHVNGVSGSVTNISAISGNFALRVQDNAVFEGNYFKLRNTDANGLQLAGNTQILGIGYGDLAPGVNNGTTITIDGSVIDRNTGSVFSSDNFATDTGQTTGWNVTLNGTSSNAIYFTGATGNIAGETFNQNDGAGSCGAIRWDDSACQFVEQRGYEWRNDDGGEAAPDSAWFGGASSAWPYRERVSVTNTSGTAASNIAVKVYLPYVSAMNASFKDIRFTTTDGVTQIPYWIERYKSSTFAYVWVKVPSLPANGTSDVYVYYGNPGASDASSGGSTFDFFYDAESSLASAGFTGDTSAYTQGSYISGYPDGSVSLGSNMLRGAGNVSYNIASTSAHTVPGKTIRTLMYVNPSTSAGTDEVCLTFGVNSVTQGAPVNNAFCVTEDPNHTSDALRFVRNSQRDGAAAGDPTNGTIYASSTITLDQGEWYEARVDWETNGKMTGTLTRMADNSNAGTITWTDNTSMGSGVGYSYWYQHGGWDDLLVTPFVAGTPSVVVQAQQQHGGATWMAAENTPLTAALQGIGTRLRFSVRNTGTSLVNQLFELDWAKKGASTNCESVPDASYGPVQNLASCSGADVCLATSSKYTSKATTTPLLSTPKGLGFVGGEIMQNPDGTANAMNLPSGTYTELEYALSFTPYATQPAYCFRVSNAGSRLVSYSHVAEARVTHPPQIDKLKWNWTVPSVSLTEGTTTIVMATGTVADFSGFTDITSATATVFRAGVGESCSANQNNCYTSASTTCTLTQTDTNSGTISCQVPIQYFAEPTDWGSPNYGDAWDFAVTVKNSIGQSDHAVASTTLNSLKALSLSTQTVDFGSVALGTTTGTYNPTTTVRSTGNVTMGVGVNGGDLIAGANTLAATNMLVASSSFNFTSCAICSQLSTTTTATISGLTLAKPNSTVPVTGQVYWGIQVPYGTTATQHSGQITVMGL